MKLALFICLLILCNTAISQSASIDSVPVRLSTLEARTIGSDARVDWKVVCLLDFAKFEVQRSPDGINYTTINRFEADRLRCREPFAFTDVNINGRAFYRIRVGDLDGRIYSSKTVSVIGKEKGFEINSLIPSIVSSNALINISSANIDNAEILITDFNGTAVERIAVKLNKGVTEFTINTASLAAGNYILVLKNRNSDTKTIRFTKI